MPAPRRSGAAIEPSNVSSAIIPFPALPMLAFARPGVNGDPAVDLDLFRHAAVPVGGFGKIGMTANAGQEPMAPPGHFHRLELSSFAQCHTSPYIG